MTASLTGMPEWAQRRKKITHTPPSPVEGEEYSNVCLTQVTIPFMRYALGDLLQVYTQPCKCGMPGIRFKIVGRADDMLIVKGVNVYPEAIKAAILKFKPQVTGHFRILLDKPGHLVKPPLRIRIEYGPGIREEDLELLEKRMLAFIKDEVRIAPAFE